MRMTCLTAIVACGVAPLAHAAVITEADLTTGATSGMKFSGAMAVTVTSPVREFRHKTVNGVRAAGVKGGSVNGEIDNAESIRFDFASPMTVSALEVAHLYNAGEFGDSPAEVALVRVNDSLDYLLQVTSETTADWSGSGSATNTSIATEAGGGAWLVAGTDLFGIAVTSIELLSGNTGNGSKADFGFVSLTYDAVPAPGAGAALATAALFSTRRRRV
ncbi:MAG: hypothetical protein AAGD00_04845 [Planctomycetota bacterium]